MTKKCESVRAEDGHIVPVLVAGDRKIHMGSCYEGAYAAGVWADAYISQRTENVIFFGMGDCQILLELVKCIPGMLVVYEPEPLVYQRMKTTPLYKKLIKNRKMHLFCGDCKNELDRTIKDLLDDDWVERTMVISHPGYQNLYEEEWKALMEICQRICDDITFVRAPLKRFAVSMIQNQIANLKRLKDGIPLRRLKPDWNPDLPVILVSAGPSLEKNVDELKNVCGRALIFCVDAALPTLLRHDIIPDVMVSVDSAKDMRCFEDERCRSIPLLGSSNTRKDILERGTGPMIWGYDHEQILKIIDKAGIPLPRVPYYLGVSTAMYSAVVELGAKVIILVGQDLAFAESGESHVKGREESAEQVLRIQTEGYYGGEVWSRMDWMEFKKWFEKMITRYPNHLVVNATEGGVRIRGTKQQPLADVIKALPDTENYLTELLQNPENQVSEEEYAIITEQMRQCVKDLEKIREWGYQKTFFEKDYRRIPVVSMILHYMKVLDDEREIRFEKALAFIGEKLRQGGWDQ